MLSWLFVSIKVIISMRQKKTEINGKERVTKPEAKRFIETSTQLKRTGKLLLFPSQIHTVYNNRAMYSSTTSTCGILKQRYLRIGQTRTRTNCVGLLYFRYSCSPAEKKRPTLACFYFLITKSATLAFPLFVNSSNQNKTHYATLKIVQEMVHVKDVKTTNQLNNKKKCLIDP